MADPLVKTDTIICSVAKSTPSVVARATLSAPGAGGWSMFLDGTFKQGGTGPSDVDLGPAAALIGTLHGDAGAGHAAHYSMFVVFVEAT